MIRRAIIVIALLGVGSLALAQPPSPSNDKNIPPGLTQKKMFVSGLIEDESVARRIQASNNAEAQHLLAAARDYYAKALAALENADFSNAENQFNETMSALGKARRLVPDTEALVARQRAEYAATLASIEALQQSYLSYLQRVKFPSGNSNSERYANLGIARFLDEAQTDAKAEHWDAALHALEKAEQIAKTAMGQILGLIAVEYIHKFETPAAEYAHYLERNRSLLELIPVVIAELKPTEDTRQTIDYMVEQNRAAVDLANEYARLQDYHKAITNMQAAIGYLELALTAAGIILPQAEIDK